MSSSGRSIGGNLGSQPTVSTSLGLNGGPLNTGSAILPPAPNVAYRGNVPAPNYGATPFPDTAARFPALQGRPQAPATGAARRQGRTGQW